MKAKKKILLIQPSPYDRSGNPIKKRRLYFTGLALPLLAALVPETYEVQICLETIEDIPFGTDAQLIGISSMGHGVLRSIDIAKRFKQLGKTVVMGGYMVSLMPDAAQEYCDTVLIGDAEMALPELIADYEKGTLKPFYRKPLPLLSTPLPRYELLLEKRIGDFLPVQAGRGCPFTCSFCSIYCLYRKKYLKRNLEEVMRDIRYVRKLGFKKFLLLDDNIGADRDYLGRLCDEIKKTGMVWLSQCSIDIGNHPALLKKMRESGCMALSFGLESISKESLVKMGKGWARPEKYISLIRVIRKAGIDVSTEMVVGGDGDTLESIEKTASFIRKAGISVPRFYILTPIPGTDFFDEMAAEGRICNKDIYSYNGAEAVHVPIHMTATELTDAYWNLYDSVFSLAHIARRTVFNRHFFRHPAKAVFYLFVNLYYRHSIRKRVPPNIF